MAGDWIKMRKTLPTDPRIVRIMSALKADRFRTLGGVLSAWCLFDDQTEDGQLDGYTPEVFDEVVGFPGLARAMAAVGWLEIGPDYLKAPRFFEHNGQSAKRRAQEAVRKMSARDADKMRQNCGPEKRREEKSINTIKVPLSANRGLSYSPEFENFWQAFPKQRRTKKGEAYRKWKLAIKTVPADILILRAAEYAQSELGQSEYAVMPSVWLNGRMWEDEPEAWSRHAGKGTVSEYKPPSERKRDPKVLFENERSKLVKFARANGWDDERLRAAIERIKPKELADAN